MANRDALLLLGRIMMAAIFLMGGYGKLMAAAATKAYFVKTGVPLPDIAYWVAVVVELAGGILLLAGLQTRLAAVALAVFCVATALLAHRDFGDRAAMINFNKNIAMTGGYLAFAAVGAGRYSLDALFSRRR